MARYAPNATLEKILDYIAASTILAVCSAQPATYAEAVTTYRLATVIVDSGDFSKADGDISGRKLVVAAQYALTVLAAGNPTHIALCRSADGTLRFITTVGNAVTLASGGQINIATFDVEVRDPSAA